MKIKKKSLRRFGILFGVIVIIILIALFFNKDTYQREGTKFSYSSSSSHYIAKQIRGSLYDITIQTRPYLKHETLLSGYLIEQTEKKNAVVLLAGGGVGKEDELALAEKIASWGYGVITIDQRGIGKTGGYYPSTQEDMQVYLDRKEPLQHLSVYDALACADVLAKLGYKNIAIVGESMGGRYAIVAGAINSELAGVIAISSAGFHARPDGSSISAYLMSFDPDQYLGEISPRKIVMLHSTNDTKVMIEDARYTFSLAKEPKEFYTFSCSSHGYCTEMEDTLQKSLSSIFS